ncbi:MAG: mechanosensitive ion channel family protein [Ignavibacteria bacterium]|nr:mechanosensitive ion channel family protein [Ignavibacteria bacterium]
MFIATILSNEYLLAAIIIAAGFIIGKIGKFLLTFIEKRFTSKSETTLDDKIVVLFKQKITSIFLLLGTYIAITELQGRFASDEELSRILHFVRNGFYVISLYVSSRIVLKILNALVEWYFDEQLQSDSGKISETVTPLFEKFLTIVVMLGSAMILLDNFGVNIGSLLVSLGVGSLAIALAAQETIANMIAGIVILVDRPFHVGDRIQMQSGEIGDIQQIGLRSTRILNIDKNIIVVPNAELVKNRIVNYSFPNEMMRAIVRVNVAYNADVQKVKSTLFELFSSHKNIVQEPKPDVCLIDFGNFGMTFECVGFVNEYQKRFETETQLREKIIEAFRREGIEIPTQQIVQVKN